MLEPEEAAAAEGASGQKSTDETAAENVAEQSTENPSVVDMTDTTTEKMSTETEAVTEEKESIAEAQDSDVAKQQSSTTEEVVTTTDEAVVMAAEVDEKGDAADKDVVIVPTTESDKPDTAAEKGAGDAQFKTGT